MAQNFRTQREREQKRLESRLAEVEYEMKKIPGVVGVAVGIKEVANRPTQDLVFQVYVKEKKSLKDLPARERIPAEIDGIATDVILLESPSATADSSEHRPIVGGSEIDQGKGAGTLGCISIATAGSLAPVDSIVLLTNSHVAPTIGKLVGQPSVPSDCGCCKCCDVGKIVDSRITTLVDGAIATLNEGTRFTNEVLDIGPLGGSHTPTSAGGTVFKRGRTSGLTRGTISTLSAPSFTRDDGNTFNRQIRVVSTNPATPFQLGGDSGSVLVDDQNRVIGLMHAAILPAGTPAFACHIADVSNLLKIKIETSGSADTMPLSSLVEEMAPVALEEWFGHLRLELESNPRGRRIQAQFRAFYGEIQRLVQKNREVKVAWQRYHGPGFISHWIKSAKQRDYLVPDEIEGIGIQNLLIRMAVVLQNQGGPELNDMVKGHLLEVLTLFDGCRSLPELVEKIKRSEQSLQRRKVEA